MKLTDLKHLNLRVPDFQMPDIKMPELHIADLVAKIPVIQGGMGVGISLSGLASAVANEGGIGVIAAAMIGTDEPGLAKNPEKAHTDALAREIRTAREKTNGLIGVNIMVALSNFADMVKTSIKEGADVIISGAGLPLDLPKYLSDGAKTRLIPIVSSGRAATILCKKWLKKFDYIPDAFVVEGPKAGGHLGFKAEQIDDPAFKLENLVQEVVAAVKPFEEKHGCRIPIIAAGGVFSGADIRKMLSIGASGVQMGTRFVATDECDADIKFKEAYVNATEDDIEIIKSPVGLPGRAIRSEMITACKNGERKPFKCVFHCVKTCDPEKSPYCIARALANAKRGKLKHGFAFAGANVPRIDKIIPVRELVQTLKEEFAQSAPALQPA